MEPYKEGKKIKVRSDIFRISSLNQAFKNETAELL
jgi:hypothetical protein